MFCGDLNGKEIQGRGDICIHMADLLCCTAELTQHCKATILQLKKKSYSICKKKEKRLERFKQTNKKTSRVQNSSLSLHT